MKKILLFTVLATIFSLSSFKTEAQCVLGTGLKTFIAHKNNDNKALQSAFPERFCLYEANSKEYISLLIRVKKDNDLSFLKKYDAIVGSRQGRVVTLKLNTAQIEEFCKEKDLLEVETARKACAPLLNKSKKDMHVEEVWNGVDLASQYTGKDVIVGIADWGIDYTHPTLYDTLIQNYRVLAAWDQFRNQGPAPQGFNYGTLIEGQANLLAAQCDTANQYDSAYHATHVAGITGGGGAGTAYKGVAPDVNWIFCTWIPDESSVMDAYTWMRDYARAQGKRLVINNSWGLYLFGYMDGSSMLDEFINTMSDNDSVVFVVSAGNCGSDNFHIKADFSDQTNPIDTARSEIYFGSVLVDHYWGETVTLQSENNAAFSSKLEVYDSHWDKVYETPLMSYNHDVIAETVIPISENDTIVYRGAARYPDNNKPIMDWEVRKTNLLTSTIHVVLAYSADQGTVHAWNVACLSTAVGNWGYDFNLSRPGYLQGDDQYSLGEPALAEKVISVGSTKVVRVGNPSYISSFSSRGPTMCSYLKPEIVAPGSDIVSAVSSFASEDLTAIRTVTFDNREYMFCSLSGTSMSGPMVSGCVALVLQANPNLTPDQVKAIITQTADTNVNSGACPNDIWGYGTINAHKAVKLSEQTAGLSQTANRATLNVYPVPTSSTLYLGNAIQGEVVVYDLFGREQMRKLVNGNSFEVSSLKNGIYFLSIETQGSTLQTKFIKN